MASRFLDRDIVMLIMRLLTIMLLVACQIIQAEPVIPFKYCYENKEIHPWFLGSGSTVPKSNPGATIEFLRILDAQSPEFAIHYERAPWKRCLLNLELGIVDAVIGSYKPERVHLGKYPRKDDKLDSTRAFEIGSSYCLFVHKDSAINWDGNNFSGDRQLPVGVPSGYSIIDILTAKGMNIYQTKDKANALQLVQLKRLSGAALFCEGGKSLLERVQKKIPDVRVHSIPLKTHNGYMILSHQFYRKFPALAEEIWHRIATFRTEYYDQIREKYIDE